MVAHRLRNVASALDGCIRVQISEEATSYITREYGRAGTATQWRKSPCISEYFPTDLAHSGRSMRCHVGFRAALQLHRMLAARCICRLFSRESLSEEFSLCNLGCTRPVAVGMLHGSAVVE